MIEGLFYDPISTGCVIEGLFYDPISTGFVDRGCFSTDPISTGMS